MELIEDDTTVLSESEVRTGPNVGLARSVIAAGLLLAAVLLAVALTRPSTEGASPASSSTTEPASSTVTTVPTDAAGSAEPRVAPTFVLPDRLQLPSELSVPPPGQKALTLIGQNVVGQVVALELSNGSVTELDPISGQRFKARGASDNRLAGFRVFLMETITLGVDGSIRSMPVTEMDLPLVFPTPDGFLVWETTTNALWLVGDDDSQLALPALPEGLAVIAAVEEGGLLVQTLDGVTRRYDPATMEVGDRLLGSPVTIGRERYITLQCESGPCRTTVRSIGPTTDGSPADTVIVELVDDVDGNGDATISPSGGRLAFSGGGAIRVIDLDTGAEIAVLDEARNGAFVWAPDDTLFYWLRSAQSTGPPAHEVRLFDVDGHRSVLALPPSVIDLDQPLHVVRSAN